jgi:hypothetical protein
MNPVCATGCDNALESLPAWNFSECAPEVNAGEIESIFMGVPGNAFTDWKSAAEWNARLTSLTATKLVRLTVSGEKPKPTGNSKDISGGRKIQLDSDHVLNFTIDETSEANHDAIRQLECGGQFLFWYETSGGLMFGGNDGILASISAGMVIPKSRKDALTYEGSLTWSAKFTEERIVSPIA